jgi:hypothetical protein
MVLSMLSLAQIEPSPIASPDTDAEREPCAFEPQFDAAVISPRPDTLVSSFELDQVVLRLTPRRPRMAAYAGLPDPGGGRQPRAICHFPYLDGFILPIDQHSRPSCFRVGDVTEPTEISYTVRLPYVLAEGTHMLELKGLVRACQVPAFVGRSGFTVRNSRMTTTGVHLMLGWGCLCIAQRLCMPVHAWL